jgi:hypothetical protein
MTKKPESLITHVIAIASWLQITSAIDHISIRHSITHHRDETMPLWLQCLDVEGIIWMLLPLLHILLSQPQHNNSNKKPGAWIPWLLASVAVATAAPGVSF